jgi:ATP-dependent DNA helicase RecQ
VLREENKDAKLLDVLRKVKGSSVVYVRNRGQTKDISQMLAREGISASFYHAGLRPDERSQRQDDWVNNKIQVIVSTNAFGMGIDKPDVRSVVHMDLPDSLEAYFQEAGRAGRDGQKSYAVLLYSPGDKVNLLHHFEVAFPEMEEIRRVYRALGSYLQLAVGSGKGQSFDFEITGFAKNFNLDSLRVLSCLKILEQAGWLQLTEAVWLPSTFQFLVTREQLYQFQLVQPQFDFTIKTLLRISAGAFNQPVHLQEQPLAKFMKISLEELLRNLFHLQKEGILEYLPQKDKPQLTLLQERVDGKDLTIDMQLYKLRKERHLARITKAFEYAEKVKCHSQQLLEYFGENTSSPCGICDVCLGRHRGIASSEEFQVMKDKILGILRKEPLTEVLVIESFHPKRKELVLRCLDFMLAEGMLTHVEGKFHLPTSES